MAEGNEVHRFARRQAAAFAGRRVHSDSPNGGFPDAEVLEGRTLKSVEAVGKHLGYVFGKNLIVHVHLGMYGDFHEGRMPLPEARGALRWRVWTKTEWMELRGATDCSIYDREKWQALVARLGADPIREDSDPGAAIEGMQKRKTAIGLLLMDQRFFAGVGNILRAELLYRARVSPFRPGREVPRRILDGMWRDAKTLMPAAIEDRRIVTTRAKDRPHRRGPALDEEVHYVYGRHARPCFVCGTKVERQEWAGRRLYWCPECQKG